MAEEIFEANEAEEVETTTEQPEEETTFEPAEFNEGSYEPQPEPDGGDGAAIVGVASFIGGMVIGNGLGKKSQAKKTIKDICEIYSNNEGLEMNEETIINELAKLEAARKAEKKKFFVEFNWPIKFGFKPEKKAEVKQETEQKDSKIVDAEFTTKESTTPENGNEKPKEEAKPKKVS